MDFLPTQIKCVPSCAEPVSCIMCFGASTHPSIYYISIKQEGGISIDLYWNMIQLGR